MKAKNVVGITKAQTKFLSCHQNLLK